ncbi:aspartate/glutamate racemase family protein [Lentilactobacillus sp. SPB1-3]|uniref:Aspartate/glutamate racemase family protein n=1 Tax=Lentilactobacillus terminaliae TaxID=3003483 RepID=A0ACD5DHZ8_9LACO|nr:amino acid racemase [Lentilactobacillus sp. SPB1-3]MCZ0977042.1 amino acid racemase [Lentilactobacillus sp. SPB1-3]
MNHFFTIIGGMGTEATETFIHILNDKTDAQKDQDYLNYILVNHATVPDRTDYILDHSKPNPFIPLKEDILTQAKFEPDFFSIPCNTAHYFYDDLQALTDIPILHMPRLTVQQIKTDFPNAKKVGLIATRGTLHDGIYDQEILDAGYELVKPTEKIANETMELIYDNIKEQNHVDGDLYHKILSEMVDELDSDVVILGCTELSVAEERAGDHDYPVLDAQTVLAEKTIEYARKNQPKN